jgi:Gluconate 2-dehydrogenase subunit 3
MMRHLADPSWLQTAASTAQDANWSPQFLSAKQNDALIAISDRMLPGANVVHVNRVIDLLLTADTEENRNMFVAALGALGAESTRRFHAEVAALSPAQLDQILSACASLEPPHSEHDDDAPGWKLNLKTPATAPPNLRDHFENLKGWIVATYYSSEAGLRELGWNDDFYFESPTECKHPDGHL